MAACVDIYLGKEENQGGMNDAHLSTFIQNFSLDKFLLALAIFCFWPLGGTVVPCNFVSSLLKFVLQY